MLMCNVTCGLSVMRQSPLVFEPYGGYHPLDLSGCNCARSYLHFKNYTIIHLSQQSHHGDQSNKGKK